MIGITTPIYDPNGARIFQQRDLTNTNGSRRVTRTATLDGGVAVYDTGYSESDRTIVIVEENASKESIDFARYIVEFYNLIVLSMEDGAYLGVPDSFRVNDRTLEIIVLIMEKISE